MPQVGFRSKLTRENSLPRMTEAGFVAWCGDRWAEWVDGEVVLMNAVALDHADFLTFLVTSINNFVSEHALGRVLTEPFQVRLPGQRRRRSPDLFYLSNGRMSLLRKHECNGGPDLIVEIVSPESQTRDRRHKYLEYEKAGVGEYWLVDPASRSFEAYGLDRKKKFQPLPVQGNTIYSVVLPGLFFRPKWLELPLLPAPISLLAEMNRIRKQRSST